MIEHAISKIYLQSKWDVSLSRCPIDFPLWNFHLEEPTYADRQPQGGFLFVKSGSLISMIDSMDLQGRVSEAGKLCMAGSFLSRMCELLT